jgi:hypothetical protein
MERDGKVLRLRFEKPYGPYRRGETAEIKGDLADRLIAWGYAVEERQQRLIETAAAEPEAEQADLTPRRKRRA